MKLFKLYLKKEWWFGLAYAITSVFFSKGYVYPELRFEFDFIFELSTYVSITIAYSVWMLIWFFVFWKPNYLHQQSKDKSEEED